MVKTLATSVVLFLSLFFATFASGQAVAPTLGRNNVWTGSNTFNGGLHVPVLQQCTSPQVMAGYNTDFSPICVSVSGGGGGVSQLGAQSGSPITGAVTVTNTDSKLQTSTSGQNLVINCSGCLTSAVTTLGDGTSNGSGAMHLLGDSNITVQLTGQNFQFHCPGCGSGGGSPGGATGALQWNTGTGFGGVVVTGMVKSNGAGGPAQAIADTDFALPFVLTCSSGITCPKTGENYAFSLSGSAGTGDVASALFGQMGGYSGTGTTIGGATNIFFLNPAWSSAQINGLFSRFYGMNITGWSINASANTTTFTAVNALNPGDTIATLYFPSNVNFFNNVYVTVASATNTSFTITGDYGQATSSGSDNGWATFNIPDQNLSSQGVVIIPPGLVDSPAQQIVNGDYIGFPSGQVVDTRHGYWDQQASQYGVQCGVYSVYADIPQGTNLVNVGSDTFAPYATNMKMITGQQSGMGQNMTQETWTTTVTGYPYPNLSLNDNAPYHVQAVVTFYVDNSAAIARAESENGGVIPVNFPQCAMATDTVRWTGMNLIGKQMNYTNFNGVPGHDVFQQQDNLPIISWSINASAGTTTFTVPWYSAHSILVGDVYQLTGFAVSSFFVNQNVQVASHPTPTTFVVNNTFGQSTSSGTEPGLAGATTNVGVNALRVENLGFGINNQIDPRYPWTEYIGSASGVVQPPYYRPAQEFSEPANNPQGPGWGFGSNSIASITQNTGVICVPNLLNSSSQFIVRQPAVGDIVTFPYQNATGAGSPSFTIASTAGSCPTGWNPFTLGSYNGGPTTLPNNAAFTAPQAEFWMFTPSAPPQTVAFALPSTITYPYNLYMSLPFPPVPVYESNVSSHGRIIINGDEFEYMGDNFGGTASASWPITSVANASGSSTTYTGTFSYGGFSCSGNPVLYITGFTHAQNNGAFTCTANTATTFTVTNSAGVAETTNALVESPPPTIVLRTGPTSINGGAGDPVGSIVSPLNYCYGMKDNPYPVVPSMNQYTMTNWSISGNILTGTIAAGHRLYVGETLTMRPGGGEEYNLFHNVQITILASGLTSTQFTAKYTGADNAGEATSVYLDAGATPINSTYYAGVCVGNAGISLPESDGNNTTFNGSGFSLAFFNNVAGTASNDNNGTAWMYQAVNNTGYGDTWNNIRVAGTEFGVVQGPASVNQHGVRAIGPTSTGQTWKDCTFRAGYPFTIDSMQQSNMDRCDTYTTEVSMVDGSVVGASTGLYIGYTLSEYDGGGVTGVGQFTVKDYNSEPENGDHEELPPSVVSDGTNITWIGNIFEGGFNIFGGSFQHVIGTQMAVPIFNYGQNNYFDNLYGVNVSNYDSNVYNGTSQFYNWGQFNTCQAQVGSSGPLRSCGVGFVQSYNGHDVWASMMGNGLHPTENILGGMILPGEWANNGFPVVYDTTEPWWGSHAECGIGPSAECIAQEFDGFNGYIFIGPHQRITDTQMVMKALVKLKSGTNSPASFRIMYSAQTPGNTPCTPNYSLDPAYFTATASGWTEIEQPVDFTGYANCTLGIQFDSGSATNTLEIGYFNFVPFATQLYMPLATHTVGDACPVAGEFSVDATNFWVCKPSSGVTFGAGTWDYYGTAH